MNAEIPEPKTETVVETANYIIWRASEPDGETTHHLQLNNVTIHFFDEEWQEFLDLTQALQKTLSGKPLGKKAGRKR